MALGELTRQLAGQALGNSVKDLLDGLRPPELGRISESVRSAKPSGGAGENYGATLLGQVQSMQKAAKDDEEVIVLYHSGSETIRVLEFFLPSWQLAVLTGIDAGRNITRVIAPVESLALVCRTLKVEAPARPVRIGFIAPRPKPE